MELGRIGLFSGHLNLMPAQRAARVLRAVEDLGFGAVWLPESAGKEAFTHATLSLSATSRIVVATGIANIWARDPMAMANAARTLREAFGDRFLLGVGVGHRPSVTLRGHTFGRPVETMRNYLTAMAAAPFRWDGEVPTVPVVVGALGPKMLEVSGRYADGACPYLVTPAHTRTAREILGPGKILAPCQSVVLSDDVDDARRIAREHFANYLLLENYRQSMLRAGFTEADLADGGSDRLADALVVRGDPYAVRDRVQEHLNAGASHVSIQVLGPRFGYSAWSYASLDDPTLRRGGQDFPMAELERLAGVLFR